MIKMTTFSDEQMEMIELYQRHEIDGLSFEQISGDLYVEYVNAVRKLKMKIENYKSNNRRHQQQLAMNNNGNTQQNTIGNATGNTARNSGLSRRGLPKTAIPKN